MTDHHPLVTIKTRTILVWQCPGEPPRQSDPATDAQIADWRKLLASQNCRPLYLVRCRPRVRR